MIPGSRGLGIGDRGLGNGNSPWRALVLSLQALFPSPRYVGAALVIVTAALVFYRSVLFPPDPALRYPWASDSWGHLIKAEYLLEQVEQGVWYPDLFPQWYGGQQMLRYYAPLPYYALVGVLTVTDDIFVAGNWFLFLAAVAGGLSMLLYARRFGLVFATIGGVLLVLLPDNIRVAFAEGNLPRVFAAALLPATFYFLLDLLAEARHRKLSFAGLSVLLCMIVLSHAMMGAIFGVCMALFAVVYWLFARADAKRVGLALLGIFTAVLLAGWWLLPSLTGGITEIDVEATTAGLERFPWHVTLNPGVRSSNKEAYYIGLSLVIALGLMLCQWRRMSDMTKSMSVTGFITLALASTLLNDVYSALPLHHLFWPRRFMTFSGFILVLLTLALVSQMWRLSGPRWQSIGRFAVIGLVVVMLADFLQSTPLMTTRQAPRDVLRTAQLLRESSGWRVATVDLSQLGSSPSYLFSAVGGREQVYGWAYQGAATGPLLAVINQAVEEGFSTYAIDRLERLGTDDIVVLKHGAGTGEQGTGNNDQPPVPSQVSAAFRKALPEAGYRLTFEGDRIEFYHREPGISSRPPIPNPQVSVPPNGPRVYGVDTSVFAIGSGARTLALLFPEILVGSDTALDDYDIEFLEQFDTLVLAGFDWNDRGDAEEMVRRLAQGGQRVVIDLTGAPPDVLARIPRFLDVYGERILVFSPLRLIGQQDIGEYGRTPLLRPFDSEVHPWQAYVPQGLDTKEITFNFRGAEGVVVGSKIVGRSSNPGSRSLVQVTFLGLNLMYHSILTGDPLAIEVLERELGVEAYRKPSMASVAMDGYVASQDGYRFFLEVPERGHYLIPVAHHPGTAVFVDGERTQTLAVDSLVLAELPAGRHYIEVESLRTAVYPVGAAATALGVLVLTVFLLHGVRFWEMGFTFIPRGLRIPLRR